MQRREVGEKEEEKNNNNQRTKNHFREQLVGCCTIQTNSSERNEKT
jgi:hypothetical protein